MKTKDMALVSAINRTGSVTAAALATGMSQPAASAMLKQLEDRLGFDLFTREKRKLSLTANGRALLPEITNALSAFDSVNKLADGMRLGKRLDLIVGTVPVAGASLLPAAVHQLQQDFPDVSVVLRAGTALEVVDMAVKQRIALGIILGSGANEHVGFWQIARLGLSCIMRPDHAYARLQSVSLQKLAQTRYIGHARHLPVGAATAQHLKAAGFAYAPRIEVTQFSAACAFAEADTGIAVVDGLSAMYAQRHGLVAKRLRVEESLPLGIVWPLNLGLTGIARELADRLAKQVTTGSALARKKSNPG